MNAPGRDLRDACVEVTYGETSAIILLRGEIDLSCRSRLAAVVREITAASPARTTVDLAEVAFLGCEGLGFIIRLRGATGGSVTLLNPPELARRVLDLCGLAQSSEYVLA